MKKLQGRLEFLAIGILGIDAVAGRFPAALATGSLTITAYLALATNVAGH